jgi:integrase
MNRGILPDDSERHQVDGFSKPSWRGDLPNAIGNDERPLIEPALLDRAPSAGKLMHNEARRVALHHFLSEFQRDDLTKQSKMTIAEFVENKFEPEHIATLRYSGRAHYKAILKHVLKPEEVDRVFQVDGKRSKAKLKTIPGWPYLGDLRLCDTHPDHVQKLVYAALAQGYSPQTAKQIRNVVSAIFSCAMREQCYVGKNPARSVKPPKSPRKDACTLTLAETREVLNAMSYPEREMALFAVLTGMNIVEICGLQWKNVNLETVNQDLDGETILPTTIAIKMQWYRGELECVKKSRVRNVLIPQPLLRILRGLKERAKFTGPEDFVLVSRGGSPVNQGNTLERRLRPLSIKTRVPTLSWILFLRTRKALMSEHGSLFQSYMAAIIQAAPERVRGTEHNWHCRPQPRHAYKGWSRER